MPESKKSDSPAKLTSIKNGFALSQDDLYRQKPFHGTIFRVLNGNKIYLQYVKESDRLTLNEWLDHKNISQGVFVLDTENEQGQLVSIEFHIDKNTDSELSSNPFLSGVKQQKTEAMGMSSSLKDEYEAQLLRVGGRLETSEAKNRELQDELFTVKRELSEGNSKLLLDHKEEIRNLEKEYDQKVRDLEKQISALETDLKFKNLEYKNSNRDGMTRFLDMMEENGAELIGGIIKQLQSAGQNPSKATPKQIQEAIQNRINKESKSEEIQQSEQANEDIVDDSDSQLTQEEQLMNAKSEIKANLLDNALKTVQNAEIPISDYAKFARDQIAIMNQMGLALEAKDWIEMAKALAKKALEENVSAERVADVIKPLLDGVKGYAFMLKALSPKKATETLFNNFNVEATNEIKKLVSEVLGILQKSL